MDRRRFVAGVWMSRNRNPSIFAVKNEDGLASLPEWLQSRAYDDWGSGFKDRFGNPLVGLSKRIEGGERERRGLIVIAKAEFTHRIIDMVKENAL